MSINQPINMANALVEYDPLTQSDVPGIGRKYVPMPDRQRTNYILAQARTRTIAVVSLMGIIVATLMLAWLTVPAYYWGSLEFKDIPCTIEDLGISYRGCDPEYSEAGDLKAPALPANVRGVTSYRECSTLGGMTQNKKSTWTRGQCTEEGNNLFEQFTGRTFRPFGRKAEIAKSRVRRLLNHSRSRVGTRQPKCEGTYLSWALVSLPGNPAEKRCAYRYGAEAASFDPLRSSMKFIERLPVTHGSHTCRVMAAGNDNCIVALQKMSTMIMMTEAITDSDSILVLMIPIIVIGGVISLITICCRYAMETHKRYSEYSMRRTASIDFDAEETVRIFLQARRSGEQLSFENLDNLIDDEVEYHIGGATSITGMNIFDVNQYQGHGKTAFSRFCQRFVLDVRSKEMNTITRGNVVFHYSFYPWSRLKSIYLKTTFKVEHGKIVRMYIDARWWAFKDDDHWWAIQKI